MKNREAKQPSPTTDYSIRRCDTGEYLQHFSYDKLTFTNKQWDRQYYTRDRAYAMKQALETLYNTIGLTFTVSLDN